MKIFRWLLPLTLIAVMALLLESWDFSGDSASGGSQPTADTTSPATEGRSGPQPTVRLVSNDGLDLTMTVTSCENPGETTLRLEAQTEDLEDPIVLSLDASGGQGSVVLSGGDEREGTVDQLMVGDTGEISASGIMSIADDSAPPGGPFQLTGNCA